jgi:hypothetical protein
VLLRCREAPLANGYGETDPPTALAAVLSTAEQPMAIGAAMLAGASLFGMVVMKKYDPVAKKHVEFREAKIK